jgi:hypothetical protein
MKRLSMVSIFVSCLTRVMCVLSVYFYKRNPLTGNGECSCCPGVFSRLPLDSAVALRISFVYIHMRLLRQSGAVKSRSCPLARSRMGPTTNTYHCEGGDAGALFARPGMQGARIGTTFDLTKAVFSPWVLIWAVPLGRAASLSSSSCPCEASAYRLRS